ncbi:hypothetical protein N8X78_04730 [Planktomarina temperata]|nr:hypothetical protein [Planktomarina temperata]
MTHDWLAAARTTALRSIGVAGAENASSSGAGALLHGAAGLSRKLYGPLAFWSFSGNFSVKIFI